MGRRSLATFGLIVFFASMVFAQTAPEKAAASSAGQWLALVDAARYGDSWTNAAPMFKNSISKEEWSQKVKAVREPLGKMTSRRPKSATYKTTLPGAPDGQYVVMQFDSSFEHKKSAVETVTTKLGQDGQWQVVGYYIR